MDSLGIIRIFDLVTFFVSTFWLIRNVKYLGTKSKYLIFILIYIFYVLPIGLDRLYMMADYSYTSDRYGFIVPRKDVLTNLLYDTFLLLLQFCLLYVRDRKAVPKTALDMQYRDRNAVLCRCALIVGMVLPAVATLVLIQQPAMLYMFQWRELKLFEAEGSYATIERFSYIGVSASILLMFDKKHKFSLFTRLLGFVFLYVNICVQGKRAILFYAIINIAVLLYLHFDKIVRDKAKRKKYLVLMVVFGLAASYGMILITSVVKQGRGYVEGSMMYTTTRVDFLRDDRVRMAIFNSIYPDEIKIVEYPGQTFIVDFLSFIPLNKIAAKFGFDPVPYQTRFTHALIKKDPAKYVDRSDDGMTVTFIAEIISNIGFLLSLLLIPILCLWWGRTIDKYPYPYNALIICCFIFLNLFDFCYAAVFIEFTAILCWLYDIRKRKAIPAMKYSC